MDVCEPSASLHMHERTARFDTAVAEATTETGCTAVGMKCPTFEFDILVAQIGDWS